MSNAQEPIGLAQTRGTGCAQKQHNLSRLINGKHVNVKADVSFFTKNEPKTLRFLTFLCGYRYAKYNFKRCMSVDFPHRAGLIIIHSYGGGWGL